ncbi:MAG: RsmD family RNA methyltransferase [Bacteroidales bacterium]|nr:RsmD family RNA methyltransferase [Bacteroidales bacterium]
MRLLTISDWKDYELIDTGGFEKLERFGKFILSRPEPQAVWDKSLSQKEWAKLQHARFKKERNHPDKGEWVLKPEMKEQWYIHYLYKTMKLTFRLGLTSFRHIGIFPEQAVNWNYIFDSLQPKTGGSFLNLFAYTGGASMAARSAGASVVHLDSVKQVIFWAKQNMEASKLDGIRWISDDAMKFVTREVHRGKIYDTIMLDPPPYGHGTNGEKWILEDQINEMMKKCRVILVPQNGHLILNLYSIGFSPLLAHSLTKTIFASAKKIDFGELYMEDKAGRRLSRGIFLRLVT